MGPQAHFGNRSKCGVRRIARPGPPPATGTGRAPGGAPRLRFLSIEDDRHRALVDELDLHAGAEDATLDVHALGAERVAEALVEQNGCVRRSGAGKARPVALTRVRDQRELADHEGAPAGVQETSVELARFVLEDAEPGDLSGQAVCIGFRVRARDAEQNEEPGADLTDGGPLHRHASAGDALTHRPHRPASSRTPRRSRPPRQIAPRYMYTRVRVCTTPPWVGGVTHHPLRRRYRRNAHAWVTRARRICAGYSRSSESGSSPAARSRSRMRDA